MYYRLPGLAASGALMVYALLALAVFKLIPVTLTLAGIAGFILSVGMAVDANILIFERMKEELRSGKTVAAAIRAGEDRAWPSIRDSNTSTLITCGVLYFFGQQFGATIIMGFALVLAIGVMISLFSAIVVTRTFLELLLSRSWAHNARLFGMEIAPNQVGGGATSSRRTAVAGTRG
jgi:preprotein translocase subunit SecD